MSDYEEILKRVFKKFDVEKSGFLKRSQFEKFICELEKTSGEFNVTSKDINIMFDFLDKDMDNKLSKYEFGLWLVRQDKYSFFDEHRKNLLIKAHNLFSSYASTVKGESKGLRYSQFEDMMEDLNIKHEDDDFDNLDIDNNGLISFSEFCKWLKWF